MFQYIAPLIKDLLLSPAMRQELDIIDTEFASGAITLNAKDATGALIPLVLHGSVKLPSFDRVDAAMPYRKIPGPFPRAFVYHMGTNYPKNLNESAIVLGEHKMGVTVVYATDLPENAEQGAARTIAAVKQLLDRNQYLFGQLPRAAGRATLTSVPDIQIGMPVGDAVSYHLSFLVHIGEMRAT